MNSNFAKIVKNYEMVYRLGKEIINHKELVRRAPHAKLQEEFKKQENRIQEFVNATDEAHKEWKKNPHAVNPYWTGLS